MSDAVAVPGRNGTPLACRRSSSVGVAPGETRKRAPMSSASATWRGVVIVPAPTTAPVDLGRDPLDRRERHRRAQRHLDRGQAAAHERLGERDGVLEVVDHDDGDDGRQAGDVLDGHA